MAPDGENECFNAGELHGRGKRVANALLVQASLNRLGFVRRRGGHGGDFGDASGMLRMHALARRCISQLGNGQDRKCRSGRGEGPLPVSFRAGLCLGWQRKGLEPGHAEIVDNVCAGGAQIANGGVEQRHHTRVGTLREVERLAEDPNAGRAPDSPTALMGAWS